MVGIYMIKNLVNNKVYIGQSTNIGQRWRLHKSELRNNYHENQYIQNAWNKYGENNFNFSILELCKSEELDDKEVYWINEYKSYIRDYGYNIETGGSKGKRICNPILRFTLSGGFIDEWLNAYVASNELNISASTIYGCANKRFKCAGNYIFVYKSEYDINKDISFWLNKQVHKNIYQFDLYGNIINIFETKSSAEKYIGQSISNSLYKNYCSSGGYIWKYYNDIDLVDEEYCYNTRHALNFVCNKSFYQLDKKGNIIKHYNCLREAVEDGYSERLVNDCLRKIRNKHKNFLWVYSNEIQDYTPELCEQLFNKKELKISGKVYQKDINTGDIIQIYDCLERTKHYGFCPSLIGECCKGRKKQYKGYCWECEKLI